MTTRGVLYGIGVGPGDPELITVKAINTLKKVDVIFAAASTKNKYSTAYEIARPYLKETTRLEHLGFPMSKDQSILQAAWDQNAKRVSKVLNAGHNAAFLTLGDPMTFSTYGYLQRTLLQQDPTMCVMAIPGITSYQAAAAQTGLVLTESKESLLIASGVADTQKLKKQLDVVDNAVILKTYKNFEEIHATLDELQLSDKTVLVSRLGMEGESIFMDIKDAPSKPHYFSLALVKKNQD